MRIWYVIPERAVALDSEPAMLKEKEFTWISALLIPFSSLAARM